MLTKPFDAVDLRSMYEALRVAYLRLNRNGRGGKLLDYTMVAGHVIVTTILLVASIGAKLPG